MADIGLQRLSAFHNSKCVNNATKIYIIHCQASHFQHEEAPMLSYSLFHSSGLRTIIYVSQEISSSHEQIQMLCQDLFAAVTFEMNLYEMKIYVLVAIGVQPMGE